MSDPQLRAICLDLDGTLYAQRPMRIGIALRMLARHLVAPVRGYEVFRIASAYRRAQEILRQRTEPEGSEDLFDSQVGMACRLSGFSRDKVLSCVRTWFELEPLSLIRQCIRPGLANFLASARRRGVKLAVLSDYPADDKLEAMGIRDYFEVVACAQSPEIQRFKPDPAGLRHVLRCLNVEQGAALYVGDRLEVDAEAAQRAGINCAIVGSRQAGTQKALFAVDFRTLESMLFS